MFVVATGFGVSFCTGGGVVVLGCTTGLEVAVCGATAGVAFGFGNGDTVGTLIGLAL